MERAIDLYGSYIGGAGRKELGRIMGIGLGEVFGGEPAPQVYVEQCAKRRRKKKKDIVVWFGDGRLRGRKRSMDGVVVVPLRDGKKVIGKIVVVVVAGGSEKPENRLATARPLIVACEMVMGAHIREKVSDARGNFTANMSHEIRTPLNGIIGVVSLLRETKIDRVQEEYLGILEKSAASLLGIVNDILDFSSLERNRLKLERVPMNVRACMEECYNIMAARAESKGIGLEWDVGGDVPDIITEDCVRLRQVMVNLLSNGVKFTDSGRVTLRVGMVRTKKRGRRCIKFEVEDTGIGIRKRDIGKLFRSFAQLDDSNTKQYEGTGLGLAISQRICNLMGTRIVVRSKWKVGSRFYFLLGLRKARWFSQEHLGTEGADLLEGKLALVVDDKVENVRLICTHLDRLGIDHRECTDAEQALMYVDVVRYPFDLIVLDIRMPKLDGNMVAKKLREAGYKCPIIALSSIGPDLSGVEEGLFDAILTKPYQRDKFKSLVHSLLVTSEEKGGAKGKGKDPPLEPRKPLRILVVEDQVYNRKIMEKMLGAAGYENVELAPHGKAAVELIKGGERYDIIFMDIKMPYMDGIEATRRIRKIVGSGCDIIAQSAAITERERSQYAKKADFNGLVTKPIASKEALVQAIRRCRSIRQSSAPTRNSSGTRRKISK